VKAEKKNDLDFGSFGIIIGVLIVIVSIVWVTRMTLFRDDEKTGEDVTWVG